MWRNINWNAVIQWTNEFNIWKLDIDFPFLLKKIEYVAYWKWKSYLYCLVGHELNIPHQSVLSWESFPYRLIPLIMHIRYVNFKVLKRILESKFSLLLYVYLFEFKGYHWSCKIFVYMGNMEWMYDRCLSHRISCYSTQDNVHTYWHASSYLLYIPIIRKHFPRRVHMYRICRIPSTRKWLKMKFDSNFN